MHERDERDGSWLSSKDRGEAEIGTNVLLKRAIHEALKKLSENFSPEECLGIVLTSLNEKIQDTEYHASIIHWVKSVQSKIQE